MKNMTALRLVAVAVLIVLYLVAANTAFVVPGEVIALLAALAGIGDLLHAGATRAMNGGPRRR